MVKSKFDIQSPQRVLKQAQQYRQTFSQTLPLPVDQSKSMYVEKVADYNVEQVKYSIDRAKYQNSLYRKLERIDIQNRKKVSQSLLIRDQKIEQNLQKNMQKEHKKHELYGKRVVEVQKRYDEEEKKKFQSEKQQAIKLRKELKEFYEKQQIRTKKAYQRQYKAQPCYSNALERISRIQKRNEEFSQKAQLQLQLSFAKNSPDKKKSLDLFKPRSTSFDFRKKYQIYQNSLQILKDRQNKFIQHFARNQTTSLNAFIHKDEENEKVKKKINQKLKRDTQKWAEQKKKIDSRNAQVPQKCTARVQRSLQSSFRNTFSTFKDSFSKWRTTGQFNRQKIKQKVDNRKDELIRMHEDLTLRNKSSHIVDEKMLSMKQRASKVAANYL